MKKEDLFEAIGTADCTDLAHSETGVKKYHMLRVTLLAAAIAVLLVGTTFAIPALRNAIYGIEPAGSSKSEMLGEAYSFGFRPSQTDIVLELKLNENAPTTLETYYAPKLPAQWIQLSGAEFGNGVTEFYWQGYGDGYWHRYIAFKQYALQGEERERFTDTLGSGADAEVHTHSLQFGENTVYCADVGPSHAESEEHLAITDDGSRKLYWSDGSYLYTMHCEAAATDAELQERFEAVQEVDIATLLIEPVPDEPYTPQPPQAFYLPTADPGEDWTREEAPFYSNGGTSVSLAWHNADGEVIAFYQLADREKPEHFWQWRMRVFGDVTGEEVLGERHIAWIDCYNETHHAAMWYEGGCEYKLECPKDYPIEDMRRLIESIAPVTDELPAQTEAQP